MSRAKPYAKTDSSPSRDMKIVGVTGTNGKTTTTFLVDAMFRAAGRVTGLIGTVEYRLADIVVPADFTTPPAERFQALLGTMAKLGVTHVASEVSSHGLAERRVDGTAFDAAVFTNLTRDHLDYHGSMAAYGAAKRRLFDELLASSPKRRPAAIVNIDDAFGERLAASLPKPLDVVTFSTTTTAAAAVTPERVVEELSGLRGTLRTPRGRLELASPLLGRHNLANILGAVAAAQAVGIENDAIVRALAEGRGAPGRMDRVANDLGIEAFVDYAHTPDALARVLTACRKLARRRGSRVLVVFGCGGDRDRGKRAMMGRVAVARADVVVVTSDNPRGEAPEAILRDVLDGTGASGKVVVEADRAAAIRRAVAASEPEDIVVVAGKGHESHQEVAGRLRFFDDRDELARALAERTERTARSSAPPHVPAFSASLEDVQHAIGARVLAGTVADVEVSDVAFSFAAIPPGSLVVIQPSALGEDGPPPIEAIARAGAAAVLVSRALASFLWRVRGLVPGLPTLIVDDVARAVDDLGVFARRQVSRRRRSA